ncbi:lanthionine synthetase LanC family protein [Sphingobacterium bambusae]|uniref:Lanthionine synthetase LanC family protein n=1 Tax=Sphingobacterium bambusae TaxID=662858 RepID=A0ABW6BFQ1_9SPHI|nr:lanthionine synthetase LanC family protein [Sphingobacterium bambusae]WPL47460.1 lanthionine synthetase LanC family protein [Sphingobacterium bambusae]
MREVITKIANHLVMAEGHISNIGLGGGKMGIAFSLYHASRIVGFKSYSDLADNLIEFIFHELKNCQDSSFFNGIGGITMGLSSLINDKFIEPESSDVFIDMDRKMYLESRQRNINDFVSDFSVFSFGLYLLNRTATTNLKLKMGVPLDDAMMLALTICEEMYAQKFVFDAKSITYTNSVLYFLIKINANQAHYEKANALIELIVAKIIIAINIDQKLIHLLGTTLEIAKSIDSTNTISNALHQKVEKLSKSIVKFDHKGALEIDLAKSWEGLLFYPFYNYNLHNTNINDWICSMDLFSDKNMLVNADVQSLILCGLYNSKNNYHQKLISL